MRLPHVLTGPLAASRGARGETRETAGWRAVILSSATLSQFGASLVQQGTVVLGVFFASTYHLTLSQMGAVVASMTLGLMLSGALLGPLADRWGPRRLLLRCTVVLLCATVALAFRSSLVLTVALLFTLGLALGGIPLAGTKTMLALWPRERRGLPMGIRQMGVPLGALAATLALPALAVRLGLHPLYGVFAAVLVVCELMFWALLPSQVGPGATRAPGAGWQTARAVLGPSVTGFLLAGGQYSLLTYSIPLLERRGDSLALASGLLAVSQVGGALGRMALGAISDRAGGRREVTLAAAAAMGVVVALILANLPRATPIAALFALWFCAGIAFVGWNALALTWASERTPQERAGSAIGLTTSAILGGASVSAPLFGLIVDHSGAYHDAWGALALALAIATGLLIYYARHPLEAPEGRKTTNVVAEL